jgi:hypothetical protein
MRFGVSARKMYDVQKLAGALVRHNDYLLNANLILMPTTNSFWWRVHMVFPL